MELRRPSSRLDFHRDLRDNHKWCRGFSRSVNSGRACSGAWYRKLRWGDAPGLVQGFGSAVLTCGRSINFIYTDLFKKKKKPCRGEAIMQIATAAQASEELPLEGCCSHHSAKCPALRAVAPCWGMLPVALSAPCLVPVLALPRRDVVAELPKSSEVCRPCGLAWTQWRVTFRRTHYFLKVFSASLIKLPL